MYLYSHMRRIHGNDKKKLPAFTCVRTVLVYVLCTYSTCVRTVLVYVQYLCTYSTCVRTVLVYRCYLCVHTIHVYVQYDNTCVHSQLSHLYGHSPVRVCRFPISISICHLSRSSASSGLRPHRFMSSPIVSIHLRLAVLSFSSPLFLTRSHI